MSQSHILVIDDDTAVRAVLSEILMAEGHQVTVVSNGLEGIEAAKDQPVHVVLTDLQMPGIDGLETIERISKVDSNTDINGSLPDAGNVTRSAALPTSIAPTPGTRSALAALVVTSCHNTSAGTSGDCL